MNLKILEVAIWQPSDKNQVGNFIQRRTQCIMSVKKKLPRLFLAANSATTIFFFSLTLKTSAFQETQSLLKGLQCIIGRFQTWSATWKFSDVQESFTVKLKDGLAYFLMLNVSETKIFHYVFLEGQCLSKQPVIDHQHREI